MVWFTQNPWPVVLICFVLGSLFAGIGLQKNTIRNWGIGLAFFLSAGLVYYVESIIITPAEEVEIAVYECVQDCIDNDIENVLDKISANNLILQGVVRAGLKLADVNEDMHVTDLQVTMLANDSRARSHFRANGSFHVNSLNHQGHAATRWNITWQKEAGKWKIINVERLNPITGKTMQILKQAET